MNRLIKLNSLTSMLAGMKCCCIITMLLSLFSYSIANSSEPPPNIVLIFVDDMGYGDIGPFGNTVNQTPNLDRMAKEGTILRQFYVANTACTPSRSALLTGTYAQRIGMDGTVVFPGEERGLNSDEITIAEVLKTRGYATGCFGKWHLGDQRQFMPLAQGFDTYFGIPYSNDMWTGNKKGHLHTKEPYTPLPVMLDQNAVAWVSDDQDQALLCEAVTDHALEFIRDNAQRRFFCYIPHAYIHHPWAVRQELYDKADGNLARAVVEEIDRSVGRILDTLRELDLSENTLVLFTSDNGPAHGLSAGRLRGVKGGDKYEGHMRVPTITWWPGKVAEGAVTKQIAATTDLLPTFARLAGADVPQDRIIDGKDVLEILLGDPKASSPHKLHYYENDGIRRGKWKLVRKANGKTELFNLADDPAEMKDLSSEQPAILLELVNLLDSHAEEIAANTRPAGFVDPGTARPILDHKTDLPTLRQFMAQDVGEVIGESIKGNRKK